MAKPIIELLELETGTRPVFTPNNAVANVAITHTISPSVPILSRPPQDSFQAFAHDDGVLLLGFGVKFPYQFDIGTQPLCVDFVWYQDGGALDSGVVLRLWVPDSCKMNDLTGPSFPGIFLPHPNTFVPNWNNAAGLLAAQCNHASANAGTLGAPDALNGAPLEIQLYAKLQHLLPMQAAT